ncbi:hypothetical protein I5M27_18425 [Adhaeribacter sp. BT258]|uniref:Tetratricopeptide repeat-containing protein n=1 Tax=Adhaeribacter terrigena TaxID=2793070 RepID=A0ABS1C6G3_9BACT|nr:hypothetical protein [Adhaeribacter terrigena]MBK0404967.1 hypothetical protein [Adhaeribacter terrigena]
MKKILALLASTIIMSSCFAQNDQINLLPMYGNIKKKPYQLKADKAFMDKADKDFSNRKEGSEHYSKLAWGYYERGDLATAMKRFNQSWLLDSMNCQPYWGFGNITGIQGKAQESNKLLRKAIALGCTSPFIHEALASNGFEMFEKTKDSQYLKEAEKSIQESLKADPKNARAINQKAVNFYYLQRYDSALVYINKAIKIDSLVVNAAFVKDVKKKIK